MCRDLPGRQAPLFAVQPIELLVFNFNGLRAPFLYSTNGEVVWFHDVRQSASRSRTVANFHTPAALREMLERDFGVACERVRALPNSHGNLRPYQRDANDAIEQAIADLKRTMLVAMAAFARRLIIAKTPTTRSLNRSERRVDNNDKAA